MKRKVYEKFDNWRINSEKGLMVLGARQIGKSYAIRQFGKQNYRCFVELNLVANKSAKKMLSHAEDVTTFLNIVSLLTDKQLIEGETLIFIDEVQEYPEIVTMLKPLIEDGRYSYAFSGSMLGTEFRGITSYPVGYVHEITMRPMDFEEFCWAIGVGEQHMDMVRECFDARVATPDYLHEAMMRNFRAYVVVGGMPEVVYNYVQSGYSLVATRKLQADLVRQYKRDIAKYAEARAFEVRQVFDQIPLQLEGDVSHRFSVSDLGDGARLSSRNKDFLWLVNAGVALLVPRVSEAKPPLKRTEKLSMFKLYESDTGMLLSRYPQSTSRAIYLGQNRENVGGVYENVVAQELVSAGITPWYYHTREEGEVDFIFEAAYGKALPIEVKSGKKVRSHAALNRLVDVSDYKLREAVVLSKNNVFCDGKITYLPFYMTMCLNRFCEQEDEFILTPAILG